MPVRAATVAMVKVSAVSPVALAVDKEQVLVGV